jgi:hypothetical protein
VNTPGIKGLQVAPGLALPEDVVTQTLAILAKRRVGKSNAGVVLAEELYAAGLPFVAIDPKGDWYGIRSSGDGNSPGLPIPILGGLFGDVPLTPESGQLIAELVVGSNVSCIIDVSNFASDAERTRFLTDFGQHLFRLHRLHRSPRHVILEEANVYVPQQPANRDEAGCVRTWVGIIKQGGAFGLGVTVISQRFQSVSKDVTTQVETLIAMRTSSPQDRKVIADWLAGHPEARDITESLTSLANGEAWVISPQWLAEHGLPAVQRIQFRRRRTFDSGATPTMASAGQRPATLADIDLGVILDRMAAVTETTAANDPTVLRRRIEDLERDLSAARRGKQADPETELLRRQVAELTTALAAERARPPVSVEVPVLTDEEREAVSGLGRIMGAHLEQLEAALARAAAPAAVPPRDPAPVRRAEIPAPAPAATPAAAPDGDSAKLGKAERTVLAVLAQFPDGRTRQQLAVLSGYSPTSLRNPLGRLRTLGLAGKGDPIMITDAGTAAIGGNYEPLPVGRALVDHWMSALGKAERVVLGILLEAWPDPVTREVLAERSGYSETSLRNPLGRLRTLDLVHDWTADDTLGQHATMTGATQ